MKNRRPFIAGNWKMHLTLAEAGKLAAAIGQAGQELPEAELVVAPPYTVLNEVGRILAGSSVRLAAQNLFWEEKGAYTGEISGLMLRDAGCVYVIIGHSERRQYFRETDADVNKKIQAALKFGLLPIVCIGESLDEREQGETMAKVSSQVDGALEGIDAVGFQKIVMAYEPIWAIGTGKTATPAQAEEVHAFIRKELAQKYGNDLADCAIILYGGSVKPENSFALSSERNIDGFLVGGASLEAESFIQIAREAIRAFKVEK